MTENKEELLAQGGVDLEGKKWRYFDFMVEYASQVAPYKDKLLHKTLT